MITKNLLESLLQLTQSVPISEKGNSDEKTPLFSFNFSQAPTAPTPSIGKSSPKVTPHQTGYSFKAKELFDFGATELPKASTTELKSPENVESFDGSFKGHSNYIIDIALSRDYLYSCSGDKTIMG